MLKTNLPPVQLFPGRLPSVSLQFLRREKRKEKKKGKKKGKRKGKKERKKGRKTNEKSFFVKKIFLSNPNLSAGYPAFPFCDCRLKPAKN